MNPYVSVILPVYNNERTIAAAVGSILNQSFTNFELIIVNDGSTDKTAEYLSSLSDSRIRIIGDHNNQGLPKRLNQAVRESRGVYIARMDADDISFPERLTKQVAFLDAHPDVDLVAGRAVVFDDAGKIHGLLAYAARHAEITKRPWNTIPMPHPTWMMRKSWITKFFYALPEVWRAEDQDLLLRAHTSSVYACMPDVVLCYRQGAFNFKKTALARRNLLKAQLSYFLSRSEGISAGLSFFVFVVKTVMDLTHIVYKPNKFTGVSPELALSVKKILGST